MYLTEVPTSYAHVSGILDSLATSGARTINWRKPIYSTIDEMRTRAAPQAQIDAAERISIALLQHEWAIFQQDEDKAEKIRQQVLELGEAWHAEIAAAPAAMDEVMETHETSSINDALERIIRRSKG